MLCPVCAVELQMTERQGVEIDYCPKCRGVWLDRGELDKILERTPAEGAAPPPPGYAPPPSAPPYAAPPPGYAPPPPYGHNAPRGHYGDRDDRDRRDDRDDRGDYRKRRRKSFLDDLFDFD